MPSETRVRPQAPDRPVGLQQGLLLPQGLLPELRHRRGGRAAARAAGTSSVALRAVFPVLPAPELPALDRPWSILVTGIGGTGVVTIGHVLGMAAHIEGKGAALIDMVGLSQKNGAVVSHLKIAASPERHRGGADRRRRRRSGARLRSGDVGVRAGAGNGSPGRTHAVVNSHEIMPAPVHPRCRLSAAGRGDAAAHPGPRPELKRPHFIDATDIATALLGDAMAANMFTLGYAYQKGLVSGRRCSHRAGDRAQRRGGQDECRRFPVGPARGACDRAAVESWLRGAPARPPNHRLSMK